MVRIGPHTCADSLCHELELRSISLGRPAGTFADPVARLRAWHWLSCLLSEVGATSAIELDRSALMKGVVRGRRFQSITDDGFDPARIEVTATLSLLDHICRKKRYRHLREVYRHPLWRTLQDRQWSERQREALLENALKKIQLAVIDIVDASHAQDLGLEWRDHFSVRVYGPGEYEFEPLLLALEDPGVAASLATLDGMLVLVLLYRYSLDVGNIAFANQLHTALERACRTFGARWQGEVEDTWHYVAKTRVLAWMPDFAPSEQAFTKAKVLVLEEFKQTKQSGHGRASLAPDEVTRGKVERRWRRRIWMKACTLTDFHLQYVGFQKRTQFNTWLTENRQLIGKHLSKASYLLYVGEGEDPDYEARVADLPSLEIPFDENHPIVPPYVDPLEEYRMGGRIFEQLPIRPKRVTERSK